MSADDALDIEGYDGPLDDGPAYSPSPGRKSAPRPGRRAGNRTLSSSGVRGRHSRPMGRAFRLIPELNTEKLANSISSTLLLAVLGVAAIVAILYYTFASGAYPASIPPFYGALAAAIVVMLLLSYVWVRLTGHG